MQIIIYFAEIKSRYENSQTKEKFRTAFLTDLNIAKAIADTVDACPDIPILEVGPGMGVLTQYLTAKERDVKVVEIDSESVAYLNENIRH